MNAHVKFPKTSMNITRGQMLFNSYIFIYIFLPISFFLPRFFSFIKTKNVKQYIISFSSLFFYSVFSFDHLKIFLFSIFFNFFSGKLISSIITPRKKKIFFFSSITINLLILVYFKYYNFILSSINENYKIISIVLPLGISFFTFEQISFLSDIYNKKTSIKSFSNYLFFITFFPRLIAGPIYYYREYRDKIEKATSKNASISYINIGLYFFIIGLFKKVMIADSFSNIADSYFSTPAIDKSIVLHWIGTLSYTFQIYFDFSGYSEMAVGLGYLFGVKLPQNFNSPYKSSSMIEFWQRWHMTLSNFIKEYIYFTFGGNKFGKFRKYINIILTMSIAGIWHGAGYTFIVWGFVFGILITLNHIIREKSMLHFPMFLKLGITFLCVHLLWVIFRATDINQAISIYQGLFNISSIKFLDIKDNYLDIFLLVSALLFCVFVPNTYDLLNKIRIKNKKLEIMLGITLGILCFLSVTRLSETDSFIYFNF